MNAKRVARLSLLTAVALIIFIVELRLPNLSSVPGVKLGLANIITVFALYRYKASETAMIVAVRIFFGALFSGNVSSLVYSASGAFVCLAGMIFMKKIIPEKNLWLASVVGAILHNLGQIVAAVMMMKTLSVIFYFPILVVTGCIAGAFTGIAAQEILKRLDFKN